MTDKTISEKCETLYNKLNSFVTSVINRDVTPQINNLESGKADIAHTHFTSAVRERSPLSNIGTSANFPQSEVNRLIDNKIGSLSTSITNLADTTSWTYYLSDSTYKVKYNAYRVNVDVSITGTSASTTLSAYGATILSNELLPRYPISAFSHDGNVLVQIKDNDTKLYRKSMTSNSQSNINIYAHLEWDRR